jgi:hypothetical protein
VLSPREKFTLACIQLTYVCGYVCVCQVRAKSETWEGETRVKCNVVGLKPLDYAQESKLLLDRIRNYGI